jgi:phosphoglycolate phosphatase
MKTALFDLDGTLIDSGADLAAAVNLTRQDFGLPPLAPAAIVACVGDGMRCLIERAIPESPEHWDAMVVRQRENYRAHYLDQTRLYPGVREALAALREAGWALGVVTNKPTVFSRPILDGLGVLDFFGAVVGGGDCPELKPDPAPLRLAAVRLGTVLTADDWMVGDNVTDLKSGRLAGLRRCFCRYGFGSVQGESYDRAVDRLDEFATAVLA